MPHFKTDDSWCWIKYRRAGHSSSVARKETTAGTGTTDGAHVDSRWEKGTLESDRVDNKGMTGPRQSLAQGFKGRTGVGLRISSFRIDACGTFICPPRIQIASARPCENIRCCSATQMNSEGAIS